MVEINTALAGFGAGGRIYNAPIFSSVDGFRVRKILTSSPSNIEAAKSDFPNAAVVSDFSEILEDPSVDLVIVLLPNHLHYKYVRAALTAGKHVLVEKPFTTSTFEADELIKIAQERDLVLSVNHNRRWDSDSRTTKKLLENEILGEVVEYEAHFDRFRDKIKPGWKEQPEIAGSGILYDLGSHLIDQALNLFGTPQEIFADIGIQREAAKVPDNFHLLLFYPNTRVVLRAGMLVKEKGPTLSIFGTKGSFIKYGVDVQEEALKKGKKPRDHADWGKEPQEIWGKLNTTSEEKLLESERGDYRLLYENLYNAVVNKAPLKVTPKQARDVVKVIELAQKSSKERRAVSWD
ncbi:MAG: Gfo/Idh/MocA family oxidoreductase [Salinimicrobium sp.]